MTALEAERTHRESQDEQQRIVELELQQARYEASLAERRYAVCDPDHRLIAAQLEKRWEASARRVHACQARLDAIRMPDPAAAAPDFAGLADDLQAAWNAASVTMRARQRLLRALITDIIADVDEATGEVVLTIHWRGGQHPQLRVRKPEFGEHRCPTPEEALAVGCWRGLGASFSHLPGSDGKPRRSTLPWKGAPAGCSLGQEQTVCLRVRVESAFSAPGGACGVTPSGGPKRSRSISAVQGANDSSSPATVRARDDAMDPGQ